GGREQYSRSPGSWGSQCEGGGGRGNSDVPPTDDIPRCRVPITRTRSCPGRFSGHPRPSKFCHI
ncbi:hypothetical protein NDU88_005826, partial [Pleurodeles waltl]